MNCVKSISTMAALAAFTAAPAAFAHISLEQGGTHLSRYGDTYLKELPCGKAGGTRGTNIYTYAPGSTITVSFVETISHPSYFRFAFQANGDNEFKEPASIKPIDPARPCPIDSGDHCGASDFYNTPNVLPMMDNLDPHLAGASKTWTYQVTLPNVECDNCTLQIIQVMEDNQFHGDYDPTPGVGVEDIYHQCIDLVLKAGAPMGNDGGAGAGGSGGGGGTGGTGGTGGGTGGTGGGGSGGTGGAGGNGSGGTGSTSKGGCAMARDTSATLAGLMLIALAALALRRRTR